MWLGVYCIDLPIQRLDEYAIVRFSDPNDRRLDELKLSILWERKTLPRLGDGVGGDRPRNAYTITCFPLLLTSEVS